jgi:Carbohydrate-selective porin, OprB family/S-layer homology domain
MKPLVKSLPMLLGCLALATVATQAKADDNLNQDILKKIQQAQHPHSKTIDTNFENNSFAQVTSVNEIRDVAPTDWAYEALRSLVERYGCIVGYPDRTYRGNQPLTRWEFAAGLNACMNSMERLIRENAVSPEDLERLKKLAQEFRSELAALGARIDNLEQRVAFLEDHQFSTTTKLVGEVIFSIAEAYSGGAGIQGTYGSWRNNGAPGKPYTFSDNVLFTDRVRLNFLTSFSGKDQLKVRLQAGNGNQALFTATGVPAARLAYDDGTNNNLVIDDLWYKFPVGNLTVTIGANSLNLDDVMDTYNPYLQSSGTGSVSRAERYNNMVYRSSSDGTGLALNYKFIKEISLDAFYLAKSSTASNPNPIKGQTNGLFGGGFAAGTQLNIAPVKEFKFGLTYVHTYDATSPNLFTVGSPIGNNPFNGGSVSADRYGIETTITPFKGINFTAWGGTAQVHGQGYISGNPSLDINNRNGNVWTWNAALNVLDLGIPGSVLSFGGGLLPSAFGVDGIANAAGTAGNYYPKTYPGSGSQDRNTSYIAQIQYAFPIGQYIQITPAMYAIFNPNNYGTNNTSDNLWIGVIRTTFTF